MISPWIVGGMCFTFIPLLFSFGMSFTNYSFFSNLKFVGLENYITMFTADPLFWKSLGITLLYAVLAVPVQMIWGFLIANLLNQKLRGIVVFRTIFYVPCLIVVVSTSLLWRQMLDADFGVINYVLTCFGLDKVNWLSQTSTIIASAIFISLWQSGKMVIINLAGIQGIPTALYEAADLDGCSKFKQAFHITLPLLTPVLFMNLILGMIGAFKSFTMFKVLTNGGPNNASLVYMLHLYNNAFANYKLGYANAMSVFLFIIVAALTLLVFRSSKRWVYYGGGE